MKILLIEDDILISDVIKRGLEKKVNNFIVDVAHDGKLGLQMGLESEYAVILLDIMLPSIDGWRVCEELRNNRIKTPILMLTARNAVSDRVHGLDIGADDYLPKPFDFAELLARVKALIRREKPYKAKVMKIGDLIIDTSSHQVIIDGREVHLSSREYTLLEALARNVGHILSREIIQYRVWNDEFSTSNTAEVYIGLLRKKIDVNRTVKLIHTIHGEGYMLVPPDKEV